MRNYLIVDDNRPFAENLAEILEDQGDRVVVVTSGQEAIGRARHERFDALLSDMRMPLMSGAEVIHAIRAIDADLPAIAITAYTQDGEIAAARREGLLGVLSKPVSVPSLLGLLGRARRGGLVALIEDNEAFADNVSETLRDRGFSVVAAASVTETERLAHLRPFVGLVDVRVPGGPDGEAMRRLVAKNPGLPIVAMTAYPDIADPPEAVRILRKPFSSETLIETIEHLYGAREVS